MLLPILPVVLDFETEALNQGAIPKVGPALFGDFVSSILSGIMVIALILVLLQLGQGALDWINSSGDKAKLDSARQKITNAIIGVIVLAAMVALFVLVQSFLGVEIIDFGGGAAPQQSTNPLPPGYGLPGYDPGVLIDSP